VFGSIPASSVETYRATAAGLPAEMTSAAVLPEFVG
jgi:hypothetical protein